MKARQAGLLLAVSSLPGPYPSGDLGPEAFRLLERMAELGLTIWQTLPLNRVDTFGCPYSSPSAFGSEPNLLSLDWFVEHGFLKSRDLASATKMQALRLAYQSFIKGQGPAEFKNSFREFRERHDSWLVPLARFLEDETLEFQPFLEFVFRQQWARLRQRAEELNIRLIGDVPIFVAANSVDVKSHPEQFKLDDRGNPRVVAGVPPDAFTDRGQNWGSPVYEWDVMAQDGWSWWRQRLARQFDFFHSIRLDHFRGFAATWEIPAHSGDARQGKWVKAGGEGLVKALSEESPDRDGLIAEDLGVITEDVDALREKFNLPTMRVLQFHWNQEFPRHCVAYAGTHDNDTLLGWYKSLSAPDKIEIQTFAGIEPSKVGNESLIKALLEKLFFSAADWCIVPMQDLLALGSTARMNTPGTTVGNWQWRLGPEQFNDADLNWLKSLIARSER